MSALATDARATHAAGVERLLSELQQHIPGISQRMLSLTLKHLARDGLVTRTSYPEVPPRVEYELTPMASTLIPHAVDLANWAVEHNPEIDAFRARHDDAATVDDRAAGRRTPAASPTGVPST